MKIIEIPNIPQPKGHYSHCVEHNGTLYVSGQLPFVPQTRELPEGIEAQTLQVLKNVENILVQAGSAIDKVLQVRIYIPDMIHWDKVNEVYAKFFGNHKPARCVVPSRDLHYGVLIEVEVTAYL
jgi:reactive intermediate/imine deaminase